MPEVIEKLQTQYKAKFSPNGIQVKKEDGLFHKTSGPDYLETIAQKLKGNLSINLG